MAKITPKIGTKGRFLLKQPWVVSPGEIYTVTAIRTLEELSKQGVDPKESIYEKMGLVDGNNGFNWKAEVEQTPFFITLSGTQGNKIVVPDTYIQNYPDVSPVMFERVFVSVSLGAFPIDEDLSALADDIAEYARTRTNLVAHATLFKAPLLLQPTASEYQAYILSRFNSRPDAMNSYEEVQILRQKIASLQQSNAALVTKLQNHGLLP